jgi:hypothetical protein
MCEFLDYEVTQLVRLRIMNVHLGKLKVGQWRNLTEQEMAQLNIAISGSTGSPPKKSSQSAAKKRKPQHRLKGTGSDAKPARKSAKSRHSSSKNKDSGSDSRRSARKQGSRKSPTPSKRRK